MSVWAITVITVGSVDDAKGSRPASARTIGSRPRA
jgi:hypothetical protein